MTQDIKDVLKLALEWAEAHGEIVFAGGGMDALNKMNSWVTAIKEALRENAMREVQRLGQEIEQEPVALPCCGYADASAVKWNSHNQVVQCHNCGQVYETPPQLEERNFCPRCGKRTKEIHTCTPPQRTWQGLTDEDKKQITKEANYHWEMTAGEYADRIGELTESKLKEKNT